MLMKNCYICERDVPLKDFNSKRKECKECSKGIKLFVRYGITQEQYNEKLKEQGGHCAICPYTPRPGEVLAQDHDHSCCASEKTCGACLRALLCDWCNRGLGYFKDSPEALRAAAAYLEIYERIEVN
jgi:recombination endonuclease VII